MTFPYLRCHDIPDLENFYFKFHDFLDFSRICMNPVKEFPLELGKALGV